jgi:hypothetical protein
MSGLSDKARLFAVKSVFALVMVMGFALLLQGCSAVRYPAGVDIDNHASLSKYIKNGYGRNLSMIDEMNGKEVKLWGYVDYERMALEPGTIDSQPEHWTDSSEDDFWHFYIKRHPEDASSESILVTMPKTREYRKLFEKIRDMENVNRSKLVFVTGIFNVYKADIVGRMERVITVDVTSPSGIYFRRVEI